MRFLWIFTLIMSGCIQLKPLPTDTPPTSTIEISDNASWEILANGLEERRYQADSTILQALRINPEFYEFRVHYRPNEPLRLEQWKALLPDAVAIININFFSVENTALGLLVSDGQVFGQSYSDRGGTFFVLDGQVGIRSNIEAPYQGEAYSQAAQAFPMLVSNGLAAYQNSQDTRPSRRSLIGIDNEGYIVIMATPGFGMGLYALSQYLSTSDLGLVSAFNLDGGGSTMLYIAPNDYLLNSFDPVPAILAVYPR